MLQSMENVYTPEQIEKITSLLNVNSKERLSKLREFSKEWNRPEGGVFAKFYELRTKSRKNVVLPIPEVVEATKKITKGIIMSFDIEFDFPKKKLHILG